MEDPLLFNEFTATSGLRVYHQYRDLPWFGFAFMVNAGYRHAPKGKVELPHLDEHVLSCGTKGYHYADEMELEDAIEQMQWEYDLGHTGVDVTHYSLNKVRVRDAGEAIAFLDDFIRRPKFKSGIRCEIEAIRNERSQRFEEQQRKNMYERYMAIYNDPHLARMPGWSDTAPLDDLKWRDVREFHDKWYRHDNMALIVVGGLPEARLREIVDKLAGTTRPRDTLPKCDHVVRIRRPRPRTNIQRPKKRNGKPIGALTQNWFWLVPPGDEDGLDLALHGLRQVLYRELRLQQRAAYNPGAEADAYKDHRFVTIWANIENAALGPAVYRTVRKTLSDPDRVLRDFEQHRVAHANKRRFEDLSVEATIERAIDYLDTEGVIRTNAWALQRRTRLTREEVRYWLSEWLNLDRVYFEQIVT